MQPLQAGGLITEAGIEVWCFQKEAQQATCHRTWTRGTHIHTHSHVHTHTHTRMVIRGHSPSAPWNDGSVVPLSTAHGAGRAGQSFSPASPMAISGEIWGEALSPAGVRLGPGPGVLKERSHGAEPGCVWRGGLHVERGAGPHLPFSDAGARSMKLRHVSP